MDQIREIAKAPSTTAEPIARWFGDTNLILNVVSRWESVNAVAAGAVVYLLVAPVNETAGTTGTLFLRISNANR